MFVILTKTYKKIMIIILGIYCTSWLQNKLVEILWEGGNVIGLSPFEDGNELTELSKYVVDNKDHLIN